MESRTSLGRIACASLLVAWLAAGCGAEEFRGAPCQVLADCGPAGEARCLALRCVPFDPTVGLASARVDLSFQRDMAYAAASGYVHVLWGALSDGSPLDCAEILSGALTLADPRLNPMQAAPKYLVFNWTGGGTFFPDNLVQLLHPGAGLVVAAEGYSQLQGQGVRTALGCSQGIDLASDQVTDVSVSLVRP